jgi:hypothetical protein
MKKSSILALIALAVAVPEGVSFAASNKDRVGIGNRKSEEQPPQASETRQFCTEGSARIKTAGKEKEVVQDSQQSASCSMTPASRSSEEARLESRKVERSPDN